MVPYSVLLSFAKRSFIINCDLLLLRQQIDEVFFALAHCADGLIVYAQLMPDVSRGAARESDVRRIYFDLSTGAVRLIDSDHVYRWRLHEYSLRALRDAPSANLAGSRAAAL